MLRAPSYKFELTPPTLDLPLLVNKNILAIHGFQLDKDDITLISRALEDGILTTATPLDTLELHDCSFEQMDPHQQSEFNQRCGYLFAHHGLQRLVLEMDFPACFMREYFSALADSKTLKSLRIKTRDTYLLVEGLRYLFLQQDSTLVSLDLSDCTCRLMEIKELLSCLEQNFVITELLLPTVTDIFTIKDEEHYLLLEQQMVAILKRNQTIALEQNHTFRAQATDYKEGMYDEFYLSPKMRKIFSETLQQRIISNQFAITLNEKPQSCEGIVFNDAHPNFTRFYLHYLALHPEVTSLIINFKDPYAAQPAKSFAPLGKTKKTPSLFIPNNFPNFECVNLLTQHIAQNNYLVNVAINAGDGNAEPMLLINALLIKNNLKQLTINNISNNCTNSKVFIEKIVKIISNNPQLQYLNLNECHLSDQALSVLIPALLANPNLRELHLNANHFRKEALMEFAEKLLSTNLSLIISVRGNSERVDPATVNALTPALPWHHTRHHLFSDETRAKIKAVLSLSCKSSSHLSPWQELPNEIVENVFAQCSMPRFFATPLNPETAPPEIISINILGK